MLHLIPCHPHLFTDDSTLPTDILAAASTPLQTTVEFRAASTLCKPFKPEKSHTLTISLKMAVC